MSAPDGFERECGPGGLELRSLPAVVAGLEARAADDGGKPVIYGLGSVSNQRTTIEGFFSDWDEEVAPEAWDKSIRDADVRAMMNHDTNWLLGRTKSGTLRLARVDAGLSYEIDVNPDDPNAMSVHARVARGDIDGSSVWFRVIRQEWTQPTEANGLERPLRRILEAQLFETGPVVFPAFKQTTSAVRSLRPVDAVLRAVGVSSPGRRARIAADLLADPDAVEAELRHLFASAPPELRSAVCACDVAERAADPAPPPSGDAAEPAPARSASTALLIARARLDMQRTPAAQPAPDPSPSTS